MVLLVGLAEKVVRGCFKPITKRRNAKPKETQIVFNSQLKTTLIFYLSNIFNRDKQ